MDAPCGSVDWASVPVWNPHHGVRAQRLDSAILTIIRYELSAGAYYPLHTHNVEQFTHGVSGEALLRVGPEEMPLHPGGLIHILAGMTHGATALSERVVFLNISPRRE